MDKASYPLEVKQELYAYMWHDEHGRPMEGAPAFSEMDEADFKKIAGTLGGLSILLRHLGKTISVEAKIPQILGYIEAALSKVADRRNKMVDKWLRSKR